MRVPKLTEDEIAKCLAQVPEWTRVDAEMTRTYSFASFRRAIAFVNQVADAAEEADHHPDIDIRYKKVTLLLTTHDTGGLTGKDFALAAACDTLAKEQR